MNNTNLFNLLHSINIKTRYDTEVIKILSNKIIEMLNTVLSETLNVEEKEELLTTEYGIEMRTDGNGGMNIMCNLSDRIEQIGIKKGIEQEREKTITKLLRNFSIEAVSQMIDIDIDYVKQIAEKYSNL